MPRTIAQLCRELSGAYITSPYGQRTGKYAGFHRGIDLGGYGCGGEFRSPVSGTVRTAATSGMGKNGHTLEIHFNPFNLKEEFTHALVTGHHEKLLVKAGDRVKKGDVIATVGGTSHVGYTYSCHVHLEIHVLDGNSLWRRQLLDPAKFLVKQEPPGEPSDRFKAGDIIVNAISQNVIIRESPGTHSPVTGEMVKSRDKVKIGRHADNGIHSGGYHWWNISKGWVAEDFFDLYLPPDPEPVDPPELVDDDDLPYEGDLYPPLEPDEPEEMPAGLMELLRKLYELLKNLFERGA